MSFDHGLIYGVAPIREMLSTGDRSSWAYQGLFCPYYTEFSVWAVSRGVKYPYRFFISEACFAADYGFWYAGLHQYGSCWELTDYGEL